jgi:hypothetical protein
MLSHIFLRAGKPWHRKEDGPHLIYRKIYSKTKLYLALDEIFPAVQSLVRNPIVSV